MTLAWDASISPNISSYILLYGTSSRSYVNSLDVGTALTGTISNLNAGTRYYFAVMARDTDGLQSLPSAEVVYTPATPTLTNNLAPTLNPISNLAVKENSGEQAITLTGITSGSASEAQSLSVTAVSGNPAVIPNPTVAYSSPDSTAVLRFTPMVNASGGAWITVTVNDGQSVNAITQRSFFVQVITLNLPPVVNAGPDAIVTLPLLPNLSATVTDDGLPNPPGRLTSTWSKVNGPGTVLFGALSSPFSTASFSLPGQYVLRLTVSDGEYTVSDDLVVGVRDLLDPVGPVVSDQTMEALDARSLTLAWRTDRPARCQIDVALTPNFDVPGPLDASFTTTHRASLTNLMPEATYYYRIRSIDQAGNKSSVATATFNTPRVTLFAWAAEQGWLSPPMKQYSSEDALNNTYVASSTDNSGAVYSSIWVASTSNYRMWCRVMAPAPGVGSFGVSVNGGPEDIFDVAQTQWKNGWTWVPVNGRNGSTSLTNSIRTFFLSSATTHQVVLRAVETPTGLDEIIVSNDPQWSPALQGPAPVLTATAVAPNLVHLSWTDAIANEKGFMIEVSDGWDQTQLAAVPANTTSFDDMGVPFGTIIYYRIRAFNDTDRGESSDWVIAATGSPPAAPSNLIAEEVGPNRIDLHWSDSSSDEMAFVLDRSSDGITFVPVQTLLPNTTFASDAVPERGPLFYRVRAFNEWGSSDFSPVAVIRTK